VKPSQVSKRVIVERLAWVETMLDEIRALPLDDLDTFSADRRNATACAVRVRAAALALTYARGPVRGSPEENAW
jgi:hypothetical protein